MMNNRVVMCSECGKTIFTHELKYHTADFNNMFCGAKCSVEWHQKNKQPEKK